MCVCLTCDTNEQGASFQIISDKKKIEGKFEGIV